MIVLDEIDWLTELPYVREVFAPLRADIDFEQPFARDRINVYPTFQRS